MIKKILGKAFLRLGGWRVVGAPPEERKYVVIAAPHTSNWDLPTMLAFAWVWDIRPRWMAKHVIFVKPFGSLMRWLGGIAIDRRSPHDVVAQLAKVFHERDELVLVVPPEGTRARRDHWKSGFYHIARAADVPVALTTLDWRRKEGGFGPMIRLTGDVTQDMDLIRDFYADREGKHPALLSTIRLREEDS